MALVPDVEYMQHLHSPVPQVQQQVERGIRASNLGSRSWMEPGCAKHARHNPAQVVQWELSQLKINCSPHLSLSLSLSFSPSSIQYHRDELLQLNCIIFIIYTVYIVCCSAPPQYLLRCLAHSQTAAPDQIASKTPPAAHAASLAGGTSTVPKHLNLS